MRLREVSSGEAKSLVLAGIKNSLHTRFLVAMVSNMVLFTMCVAWLIVL